MIGTIDRLHLRPQLAPHHPRMHSLPNMDNRICRYHLDHTMPRNTFRYLAMFETSAITHTYRVIPLLSVCSVGWTL
jgi:hypothetical protein